MMQSAALFFLAFQAMGLMGLVFCLFWLRQRYGLTPLYISLGVFQPVQVILTSSIYVPLWEGVTVSPGTIMFAISVMAILLVYLREDAGEARKIIYGIIGANLIMTLVMFIASIQVTIPGTSNFLNISAEIFHQSARVTLVGTAVLLADVFLLMVLYGAMNRHFPGLPFLRVFVTLACVLVFDGVAFTTGAFVESATFSSLLYAAVTTKLMIAFVLSVALYLYIRFVEPTEISNSAPNRPLKDFFFAYTFREKFEMQAKKTAEAERELRVQRDFAAQIVNNIGQGLTITNEDGRFEFVNPAFAKIVGYDEQEILALTASMLTMPESRREEWLQRESRRSGRASTYRSCLRRKDGSDAQVSITSAPRYVDGKYSGSISIISDLGEQIRSEASRVAALQEASATLETLGKIGRELTASLNADAVFATMLRHVSNLFDVTSFSVYLLDPTGKLLNGSFDYEDGKQLAYLAIPMDDPTSYTAQCARERQELSVNADEEDKTNRVPGTLLSLSMLYVPLMIGDRLIGVMSIQSIRPNAYGEREGFICRTLSAYAAIALDNAFAYASAERARRQAADALLELQQTQIKQSEAEAARTQLEEQLRESQKMQAIGTLAGGIAHDFNNIIASILGNIELAREDVSDNPVALQSLNEIRKSAARARNLVQQILSFSRRQPTELKPIALGAVVDESVRMLRATLPARVELEFDGDAGGVEVQADTTQIQQVVINLVTNAAQAMNGKAGRVEIRLDEVAVDADFAKSHPSVGALFSKKGGKAVRLGVQDNGSGMDAIIIGRIFEPFFTTKPVDEGTGLGLSVVHGIVQSHHGAIVVDSTPGQGTTIFIYLPVITDALLSPQEAAPQKKESPKAGKGQRILYVDDDEALVFLVQRLLQRRGFSVSGFIVQNDALAALRANPQAFDLLVTDYNMPGMSGLDVAREARAIRADLPVAVASGFIDEVLRAQADQVGVCEVIFKVNAVEDFCDAFARLAQAKTDGLPAE